MKKTLFSILFSLVVCSYANGLSQSRMEALEHDLFPHYHNIDTKELKKMIDSGKQVLIFDARPKELDDGMRIVGATRLPYNSTEKEITACIPSKDSTIVVYCAIEDCPLSKSLAEKLVDMGYTNVFKYQAGLTGWMAAGYPVKEAK